MHNYQELSVWQKSMSLVEEVYLLTTHFPIDERFNLISQIRKCAISIPSNIAEGAGRNTNGEFKNFLGIASGSSNELYTQLLLASRLKLVSKQKISSILDQIKVIQKMNYNLISSLSK